MIFVIGFLLCGAVASLFLIVPALYEPALPRVRDDPPCPERAQDRQAIREAELERRRIIHQPWKEPHRGADETDINMGAIVQIESSGNPLAVSSAGCRGLCQIAKGTWHECTGRLGVTWTWDEDAFDPGCNRAVGQYYINTRIPAMLAAYGIPDSVTTRIGAYNWGIGNLRRCWTIYGHGWLDHAPEETQKYVLKYNSIMAQQPARGD